MKNQERVTKNSKIFLFSSIGAFLISGIFVAIMLSNLLYTPSSAPSASTTSPAFEIHFISLNKSQIKANAEALVKDYQEIGAGGFVWQNGEYYYILSSGFENKSDATLVQNNLSSTHNIQSEIVSIKFDSFTVSGSFDLESKKVLDSAVNSFFTAYKSLYDIAISIDTQVNNETSARLAVNNVHSTLSSIKANYQTLFAEYQSKELSTISNYLAKAVDISEKLSSGVLLNPTQTYASLVKYRYIEILKTYQDLAGELKNHG